ncbi:MAG: glycosyltransferase [Rhizorhabdus sp.]
MSRTDIAAVVIGRNEGPRLDRCLASLNGLRAVYIDSGSTDGSAARARAAGLDVIELDRGDGYTAARGRNAGLDRLVADPDIAYIQMVDGDCILDAGWIAAGAAALDADPALGAVFGQLREARPEESVYAWLCDVEWAVPPGPASLFGGNVLLRADAVRAVGRYRPAMIAGEDPDYAIRLGGAGWQIACLADPMAVHDAAMTRFGQWWRRSIRAGHGFAMLYALHPGTFEREVGRILFWGGIAPAGAIAGLNGAVTLDPRWVGLTAAAVLLTIAQAIRIGLREMRSRSPGRAFTLALFLGIGKYAEMAGLLHFYLSRRR